MKDQAAEAWHIQNSMTTKIVGYHFEVYEAISVEKAQLATTLEAIEKTSLDPEDIDHMRVEIRTAIDGITCLQGDIEHAIVNRKPIDEDWFALELKRARPFGI